MEGVSTFDNKVPDFLRERRVPDQPNTYLGVVCTAVPFAQSDNIEILESRHEPVREVHLLDVRVQHRVGKAPTVTLEILGTNGVDVEGSANIDRQYVCAECNRVTVDESGDAQLAYMMLFADQHNRRLR